MPTLEDVKKIAEEYMKKEIEMLYNISILSKEDSTRLKSWLTEHPHYKRLQEAGVFPSHAGFDGFSMFRIALSVILGNKIWIASSIVTSASPSEPLAKAHLCGKRIC